MNMKSKKGIMPCRPLCFGSIQYVRQDVTDWCCSVTVDCIHEHACRYSRDAKPWNNWQLQQSLVRILMRENDALHASVQFYHDMDARRRKDKARLDYLDCLNDRLNERSMSDYGWKLDINHNRVALSDSNAPSLSVREAIDEHMDKAKAAKNSKSVEEK